MANIAKKTEKRSTAKKTVKADVQNKTVVKKALKASSASKKEVKTTVKKAVVKSVAKKAVPKAAVKSAVKKAAAPKVTVKSAAKKAVAPKVTVKSAAKKAVAPKATVKPAVKKTAAPKATVKKVEVKTVKLEKTAIPADTNTIRKDEILKKLRLSKTDQKFFRELLLHARAQFGQQVKFHSEDALSTHKDSACERAGMATHMADLGTDNYRHDYELQLMSEEVDVLEMIDEALQRLEDSEYGVCLDCGEVIPRKRLEAKPYAKYCTKCKSIREQMDEDSHRR